ncbi:hypothetical protein [uncultured Tateyamaria sp.]|uniref:hypothetical protein n=1 Tax=uncultured Tateyamaria sp. TaxID=455651 RepID=UPI0026036097|nr:hypothetical protein [uncultured Tateyamaria sp.]
MAKWYENSIAIVVGALIVPTLLWFMLSPTSVLWPAMHWDLLLPGMAIAVIAGISASKVSVRRMCRTLVLAALGLIVTSFAMLFLMV